MFRGDQGTNAGVAVENDLGFGIQQADEFGKLEQGHQLGARKTAPGELLGLSNIHESDRFPRRDKLREPANIHFGSMGFHDSSQFYVE